VTLRQDWPVIDEAVSFPANIGATAPYPFWVSVAGRSISRNTTKRGRQYELNVVQTGEYTPTLSNNDGALSPVNTNGPWAANFQPYCAYRKRVMWPPSVNILTQGQAGGGTAFGVPNGTGVNANTSWQVLSAVNTTMQATPLTFSSGLTQCFNIPVSSSLAANNGLLVFEGFTVFPGLPHSFQVWAMVTGGITSQAVAAAIAWFDATGAQIGSTVTGSTVTINYGLSAWTNVQLPNQVPPANAAGAAVALNNVTAPSGTGSLAVGAAQFEQAAACSAFSLPGKWY
jgi:hypothetical protein